MKIEIELIFKNLKMFDLFWDNNRGRYFYKFVNKSYSDN